MFPKIKMTPNAIAFKQAKPVADARLKAGRPFANFYNQSVQEATSKTNPSGGGFNLLITVQAKSEAITRKRPNTRSSSSPLAEPTGQG